MLTFLKMAVIELRCRTECGKQDMDQGVTLTSLTPHLASLSLKCRHFCRHLCKNDVTFVGTR